MKPTDIYYDKQLHPNQACLLSLREIILDYSPLFTESIKWGIPCFSYQKHICCFLKIDRKRKEPYILFSDGRLLNHPKLDSATRKKMVSLPINNSKNIPKSTIQAILKQVVTLHST